MFDQQALHDFVVAAKSKTYVAEGNPLPPCRVGSHDIGYRDGDWPYLDSYFGGSHFAGQEVVWLEGDPVWAMNYFGRIVDVGLIDAARAGQVIKTALMHLYVNEGRFLGNLDYDHAFGHYTDRNSGGVGHFSGREQITVAGRLAYELDYHGGLIIP